MRDVFRMHVLEQLVGQGQGLSCPGGPDAKQLVPARGKNIQTDKLESKCKLAVVSAELWWTLTGFILDKSISMRKVILTVSAVGTMMSE